MSVKVYQVGGHVRDGLLGIRSKDIDYSVEAPDYKTMVEWIKTQGTIFLEQPEFWTVRAHIKGKQPADYVLCRKDGQYTDGRRPDSVSVGTLADDLARRDFTVNAIAFDEENKQYIDPHNGRADLELMLIRCVGNAEERFDEDALRLLRAIRFAITKGFKIHSSVEEALHHRNLCKKLKECVSEERKREELLRCFRHDTLLTLQHLTNFWRIREACFEGGKLWLMPTMKE
jgi:tRNA nucleotidyltransferase/poly(A) polymerase